jgi:hypothetical protein
MSKPRWRGGVAVVVSLGLIAWLVWRVSAQKLTAAAAELDWQLLVPATFAMVLALYLWDAVCLKVLFDTPSVRLRYLQALHVRGKSYLAGAINYELGQAALAWDMAHLQQTTLLSTLSRSVLLAFHDVVVLLGLGLLGSLLTDDPKVDSVRKFCLVGLLLLGGLAIVPNLLGEHNRQRWKQSRWGAWIESWSWRRSGQLLLVRVVYFLVLVVYAAVALKICRVDLDPRVVLSTIPLVMLADGLPSISGLGTRETALQILLRPDAPEVIVALSLVWTSVLIVGRALIGLLHLWGAKLLAAGRAGDRSANV